MAKPSHIFICGAYRSGTTLLVQILNRSDDVAICGETFYLGHAVSSGFRQTFENLGDLATDEGMQKVVERIYSNRVVGFWEWIRENVDKEEFVKKLKESDRTSRGLFDTVMAFYAGEKSIRGEKTPAHIYYVPTLLEWFPEAKIIHTFRDPRAIFVSEYKKKSKQVDAPQRYHMLRRSNLMLQGYIALHVLITWLRVVHLHYKYQKLYPDNYYFIKYEDLVSDPEIHLEKLCDFLEIDFTENLLQPTVVNSSFTSRQTETKGFDVKAIDRWRQHLSPLVNRWFILWCRKHLLKFGYQL